MNRDHAYPARHIPRIRRQLDEKSNYQCGSRAQHRRLMKKWHRNNDKREAA